MKPTAKKPYFTAKTVAALLAGDNRCEASAWIKSRFWYEKRPRSFDFAAWQDDHNAMVSRHADQLRMKGYIVTLEGQNSFKLEGEKAVFAGKADIVAVKGETVLIPDCKTGTQRTTDWWQVLIYMACYPLDKAHAAVCLGKTISGEIAYTNGVIEIPPSDLTPERRDAIFAKIRELSRVEPYPMTPSKQECEFCDIAECQSRMLPTEPTKVTEF